MNEDDYDNKNEDANDCLFLGFIHKQWEQFLSWELEIEKKLLSDVGAKNVSEVDVDLTEKGRELKCDDLNSSVPADLLVVSDSPIDEIDSPSTANKDNESLTNVDTNKN